MKLGRNCQYLGPRLPRNTETGFHVRTSGRRERERDSKRERERDSERERERDKVSPFPDPASHVVKPIISLSVRAPTGP